MLVIYIYVALAAYNTGHLTLPLNSIENIVDEAANIAVLDQNGQLLRRRGIIKNDTISHHHHPQQEQKQKMTTMMMGEWRNTIWNKGTDAVMDIPVGAVCDILYNHQTSSSSSSSSISSNSSNDANNDDDDDDDNDERM